MSPFRRALPIALLGALLLAPQTGPAQAQDLPRGSDTEWQLAQELHRATMPHGYVTNLMREVFQELHPDQPAGTWDSLYERIPFQDKAPLSAIVPPIYIERLSAEEMREQIAYYQAPEGRQELSSGTVPFEAEVRAAIRTWMEPLVADLLAGRKAGRADPGISEDLARQVQTAGLLRDIGQAVMHWLSVRIREGHPRFFESTSFEEAYPDEAGWQFVREGDDKVYAYRRITHAEIEAELVPDYLDAVPENDAWGFPIQFALQRDLRGSTVVSLRSPGRDGVFDGNEYPVGPFRTGDFDRDTVWADGYFVHWPEGVQQLLKAAAAKP